MGRRPHLLGRGELAERLRAAHQDRQPESCRALGLAPVFHQPAIVTFLIAAGADVSAPSRNRMKVPRCTVRSRGRIASSLALIAPGADVNAKQQDDVTALHEATQNGARDRGFAPGRGSRSLARVGERRPAGRCRA